MKMEISKRQVNNNKNNNHHYESETSGSSSPSPSSSSPPCRPSLRLVVALLLLLFVIAAYITLVFVLQPFAAASIDGALTSAARQAILRTAQALESPLNRTSYAIHGRANATRSSYIRYARSNIIATLNMEGSLLQGGLALGHINEGQTAIACRTNDGTYGALRNIYTNASRTVALIQIYQAFASGFYNGLNGLGRDNVNNVYYREYNTTSLEPLNASAYLFTPVKAQITSTGVNGATWNQSRDALPIVPTFMANFGFDGQLLGSFYYALPWTAFDPDGTPFALCSAFIRTNSFGARMRDNLIGGDKARAFVLDNLGRVAASTYGEPFYIYDNYTNQTGGRVYKGCLLDDRGTLNMGCLWNISDYYEYRLLAKVLQVIPYNASIPVGDVKSLYVIEDGATIDLVDRLTDRESNSFFFSSSGSNGGGLGSSVQQIYSVHTMALRSDFPRFTFRLYLFIPLDYYLGDVRTAVVTAVATSGGLAVVFFGLSYFILTKVFRSVERLAERMARNPWEATDAKHVADITNLLGMAVAGTYPGNNNHNKKNKNNLTKITSSSHVDTSSTGSSDDEKNNDPNHRQKKKEKKKKSKPVSNKKSPPLSEKSLRDHEASKGIQNDNSSSIHDGTKEDSSIFSSIFPNIFFEFIEVIELEMEFLSFRKTIDMMRGFMPSTMASFAANHFLFDSKSEKTNSGMIINTPTSSSSSAIKENKKKQNLASSVEDSSTQREQNNNKQDRSTNKDLQSILVASSSAPSADAIQQRHEDGGITEESNPKKESKKSSSSHNHVTFPMIVTPPNPESTTDQSSHAAAATTSKTTQVHAMRTNCSNNNASNDDLHNHGGGSANPSQTENRRTSSASTEDQHHNVCVSANNNNNNVNSNAVSSTSDASTRQTTMIMENNNNNNNSNAEINVFSENRQRNEQNGTERTTTDHVFRDKCNTNASADEEGDDDFGLARKSDASITSTTDEATNNHNNNNNASNVSYSSGDPLLSSNNNNKNNINNTNANIAVVPAIPVLKSSLKKPSTSVSCSSSAANVLNSENSQKQRQKSAGGSLLLDAEMTVVATSPLKKRVGFGKDDIVYGDKNSNTNDNRQVEESIYNNNKNSTSSKGMTSENSLLSGTNLSSSSSSGGAIGPTPVSAKKQLFCFAYIEFSAILIPIIMMKTSDANSGATKCSSQDYFVFALNNNQDDDDDDRNMVSKTQSNNNNNNNNSEKRSRKLGSKSLSPRKKFQQVQARDAFTGYAPLGISQDAEIFFDDEDDDEENNDDDVVVMDASSNNNTSSSTGTSKNKKNSINNSKALQVSTKTAESNKVTPNNNTSSTSKFLFSSSSPGRRGKNVNNNSSIGNNNSKKKSSNHQSKNNFSSSRNIFGLVQQHSRNFRQYTEGSDALGVSGTTSSSLSIDEAYAAELIDFRKRVAEFTTTLVSQTGLSLIEFFGDALLGCFRIRSNFQESRLVTNLVEQLFDLQNKELRLHRRKEKRNIKILAMKAKEVEKQNNVAVGADDHNRIRHQALTVAKKRKDNHKLYDDDDEDNNNNNDSQTDPMENNEHVDQQQLPGAAQVSQTSDNSLLAILDYQANSGSSAETSNETSLKKDEDLTKFPLVASGGQINEIRSKNRNSNSNNNKDDDDDGKHHVVESTPENDKNGKPEKKKTDRAASYGRHTHNNSTNNNNSNVLTLSADPTKNINSNNTKTTKSKTKSSFDPNAPTTSTKTTTTSTTTSGNLMFTGSLGRQQQVEAVVINSRGRMLSAAASPSQQPPQQEKNNDFEKNVDQIDDNNDNTKSAVSKIKRVAISSVDNSSAIVVSSGTASSSKVSSKRISFHTNSSDNEQNLAMMKAIRIYCGIETGNTRVLDFSTIIQHQQKSEEHNYNKSNRDRERVRGNPGDDEDDYKRQGDSVVQFMNADKNSNDNNKREDANEHRRARQHQQLLRPVTFLCDEVNDSRKVCLEGRREMDQPFTYHSFSPSSQQQPQQPQHQQQQKQRTIDGALKKFGTGDNNNDDFVFASIFVEKEGTEEPQKQQQYEKKQRNGNSLSSGMPLPPAVSKTEAINKIETKNSKRQEEREQEGGEGQSSYLRYLEKRNPSASPSKSTDDESAKESKRRKSSSSGSILPRVQNNNDDKDASDNSSSIQKSQQQKQQNKQPVDKDERSSPLPAGLKSPRNNGNDDDDNHENGIHDDKDKDKREKNMENVVLPRQNVIPSSITATTTTKQQPPPGSKTPLVGAAAVISSTALTATSTSVPGFKYPQTFVNIFIPGSVACLLPAHWRYTRLKQVVFPKRAVEYHRRHSNNNNNEMQSNNKKISPSTNRSQSNAGFCGEGDEMPVMSAVSGSRNNNNKNSFSTDEYYYNVPLIDLERQFQQLLKVEIVASKSGTMDYFNEEDE